MTHTPHAFHPDGHPKSPTELHRFSLRRLLQTATERAFSHLFRSQMGERKDERFEAGFAEHRQDIVE